MTKLPAKSSSMTWKVKSFITKPKLLLLLSLEKIPQLLLLKLKRKLDKLPRILNKTKIALLTNPKPENNNTPLGSQRMLNTLNKLKPLMKPQRSFNTYKLVLLSLKSRADLIRSKPNQLKENTLSSRYFLSFIYFSP